MLKLLCRIFGGLPKYGNNYSHNYMYNYSIFMFSHYMHALVL